MNTKRFLNKIHVSDCVKFMKKIEDSSIDLVVTSPPYDQLRKYEEYSFDLQNRKRDI